MFTPKRIFGMKRQEYNNGHAELDHKTYIHLRCMLFKDYSMTFPDILSEMIHPGPFSCGHKRCEELPIAHLTNCQGASLLCPGELVHRKRPCLLPRNRDLTLDICNLREKVYKTILGSSLIQSG